MNSLQPSAFNLSPPPTLQWQPVRSSDFLAISGQSYPVNTTSSAITVTLPLNPSPGNQITLTDYSGTWDTNNLTINPNGNKVNGYAVNLTVSTERGSINLVYVDSTQGWISYASNLATTIIPVNPLVEYLVVGGGGGGGNRGGGGGGGGAVNSSSATKNLGTAYTITVGAGGTTGAQNTRGGTGNQSVFDTVTSAGGGGGGAENVANGNSGASGGGAGGNSGTGGSATAGSAGGNSTTASAGGYSTGGGGGSTAAGANATGGAAGNGGAGTTTNLSGSSLMYGYGGGGGYWASTPRSNDGNGNVSGGNADVANGVAGAANRGAGGGGSGFGSSGGSGPGAGGSGVVILKIPSSYTATFSGGVTSSLSMAVAGYKIYTVTATSTTSETVTFS